MVSSDVAHTDGLQNYVFLVIWIGFAAHISTNIHFVYNR